MTCEKQNCPLCGRPAEFCYVDHENRKYFRCGYCTDFQLYIHAEKPLEAAPQQRKDQLAKASHDSQHEKVLFIGYSPDKENPEKGFTLHAEFCDRAKLPLS
jgi:hypothetical protein